jgi:hypothetical protein
MSIIPGSIWVLEIRGVFYPLVAYSLYIRQKLFANNTSIG